MLLDTLWPNYLQKGCTTVAANGWSIGMTFELDYSHKLNFNNWSIRARHVLHQQKDSNTIIGCEGNTHLYIVHRGNGTKNALVFSFLFLIPFFIYLYKYDNIRTYNFYLIIIDLYHQAWTSIYFWCKRDSNLNSLFDNKILYLN